MRKGLILSTSGSDSNGNPDRAKVSPLEDSALECEAVIPWHLRGKAGDLQKGTAVIFSRFVDGTALIHERADGEWFGVLYGPIKLGADTGLDAVALAQKVKQNDDKLAEAVRAIAGHSHAVQQGTTAVPAPNLATYATLTTADVGASDVEAKQ